MPTVLIVDDEKNIRGALGRMLRLEGYGTAEAADGREALGVLAGGDVDLVLLDLQMPVLDGLGLLEAMRQRHADVPSVVLTAHGSIEKAVRALRLGASDFVEKPPVPERILLAVENVLRLSRLERENRRLAEDAGRSRTILGESAAARELRETIARVAPTEAAVLVLGENGSGKELAARALHDGSPRRARPFVTVNVAAIPETLFESELFGHTRGAFTGATEARRGKFQQADGGTLFLDEIGEIPGRLQPKLLRALESGEVERVGGAGVERVNVRIVAATNRDLEQDVLDGRFRQDLYYRLLVVPIRVPPLRERRDDLPALARHFLDLACRRHGGEPRSLSEAALSRLTSHEWPGNVRELRNAMERVAILAPGRVVNTNDLDFLGVAATAPGRLDLAGELARHERSLILAALSRTGWRMSRAAEELGLERSHLYKKLKALGIERPSASDDDS